MTTTTVLDYLLSFTSNLPPEKTVLPLLSLHTPENFTCAPGRLGPWKKSTRPESSLKIFLKKSPSAPGGCSSKGKILKKALNNK
jgi:hypothetical protein